MEYSFFELILTRFIPDELKFKTFSVPHFAYLACSALLIYFIARRVKKMPQEKAERLIKILSLSLIVIYFYRFYMFWKYDYKFDFIDNLPFHLCIIHQFVIPYAIYRKKMVLLNLCYSIGAPAAAIAMFTPSMLYKEYFYLGWFVFFFFILHAMIVMIPILCICSGIFRPDYKLMPKACAVFLGFVAFIYGLNKLLNANFLFVNIPEPGTLMEPFYNWLGNPGFILPLLFVLLFVLCMMYLPWIIIDKRREHTYALALPPK